MSGDTLRIAAAQYPPTRLADWPAYVDKVSRWVAEAAWSGARLLVFPEYGAMELVSLLPTGAAAAGEGAALPAFLPRFRRLFAELAGRHGVHILAPSLAVATPAGMRNLAHLVTPEGAIGVQEQLSTGQREPWGVGAGAELRVFATALDLIGVCLGHDIESPLLVRRQVEAGARLIVVPSCSDGMAGYHRVRMAAQARALENRCYVIQAPTVGRAPWSAAGDVSVGAAAVFAPPDIGMPSDGVLAMGALNEPQWLFAELDFDALDRVRRDGRFRHDAEWAGQGRVAAVVTALR